jgi:uncharacterized DUF497 family protein
MNTKRSTPEFDWDEHNIRHLRRHQISQVEFEQAAAGDTVFISRDNVAGEERWIVAGATNNYSVLVLVYVDLGQKRLRPITGWDAPKRLTERFFRHIAGA